MTVREYIGARYVPLFMGTWDNTKTYEPLSIVQYQGNSYTSRQYVPTGIAITNETYWAETGNFNAQVEAYRQEVLEFTDDVGILNSELNFAFRSTDTITVFSDSTFQRNTNPLNNIVQKSVCDFISEMCDATVINRGVSGQATSGFLTLLNSLSPQDLEGTTYIIVAYGTNDWQGNINPLNITATGTSFEKNYRMCLTKLQQLCPTAQIVCVTPGYIHSDKASVVLNYNNTGNDFKTYCDVISNVAYEFNVAVLRLDALLGINEYNYTSKMIPSGAIGHEWQNIYVHYKEETCRRIANMICTGLFLVNCNRTNSGINITPPQWKINNTCINGVHYGFGHQEFLIVPPEGIELTTPILFEGVTYSLVFLGGYPKITCDDEVLLVCTNQSICCLTLIGDGTAKTLKFIDAVNSTPLTFPLGLPILIKGRPDIYTAINMITKYYRCASEIINDKIKIMLRSNEGIHIGRLNLVSGETLEFPSTATTPIFTLNPNTYPDGLIIGVVNTGVLEMFSARVNNGNVYLNDTTLINKTATVLQAAFIGINTVL